MGHAIFICFYNNAFETHYYELGPIEFQERIRETQGFSDVKWTLGRYLGMEEYMPEWIDE